MNEGKIRSISWELEKLYKEGYTHDQMSDMVQIWLDEGKIKTRELIEALVDSRWNEITLSRKIDDAMKSLS